MRTTIIIHNVDAELFRELQIEAKRRGKETGEAVNEAIQAWIKQKPRKRGMLAIRTRSFGKSTENLGMEIDEELYGKYSH
jgi:hypothetical protein